jgi:hypothetical protein
VVSLSPAMVSRERGRTGSGGRPGCRVRGITACVVSNSDIRCPIRIAIFGVRRSPADSRARGVLIAVGRPWLSARDQEGIGDASAARVSGPVERGSSSPLRFRTGCGRRSKEGEEGPRESRVKTGPDGERFPYGSGSARNEDGGPIPRRGGIARDGRSPSSPRREGRSRPIQSTFDVSWLRSGTRRFCPRARVTRVHRGRPLGRGRARRCGDRHAPRGNHLISGRRESGP